MYRWTRWQILLTFFLATPAFAGWNLDPARSHLSFISVKAKDVAEVHTFNDISGSIDEDGQAKVVLMLDSVETLIPIRNERMRELLFETMNFKEAVLSAKVDPETISNMLVGEIMALSAEGTLSLHGVEQAVTLNMQAARVAKDMIMIASAQPVVVDAAKFGLDEGVEKLREIAGLPSISNAVPVSFVMTFVEGG